MTQKHPRTIELNYGPLTIPPIHSQSKPLLTPDSQNDSLSPLNAHAADPSSLNDSLSPLDSHASDSQKGSPTQPDPHATKLRIDFPSLLNTHTIPTLHECIPHNNHSNPLHVPVHTAPRVALQAHAKQAVAIVSGSSGNYFPLNTSRINPLS
jgi:hypothetical protein